MVKTPNMKPSSPPLVRGVYHGSYGLYTPKGLFEGTLGIPLSLGSVASKSPAETEASWRP